MIVLKVYMIGVALGN